MQRHRRARRTSTAAAAATSLQTDNHVSTPTLSFLQAGCSYSVKALQDVITVTESSCFDVINDFTTIRHFFRDIRMLIMHTALLLLHIGLYFTVFFI